MTRFGYVIASCGAALSVGVSAALHPRPALIWNASASVPIGFYAVSPPGVLHIGELVVVTPPEPLAGFLAGRGYLPKGVPLLKHVAALSGQTVCRVGRTITVDGAGMGEALDRYRRGRALPAWRGCRRIAPDEVFLMNRRPADSLDGRYFGPLPITTITARADPLWTEAAP